MRVILSVMAVSLILGVSIAGVQSLDSSMLFMLVFFGFGAVSGLSLLQGRESARSAVTDLSVVLLLGASF